MQRSKADHARSAAATVRSLALVALSMGCIGPLADAWAAPKLRAFGVESDPPGAEVYTISGRIGTTPAFVSERDIYPNTYPEQKVEQYGLVILRREGCQEYRRRITIDDINHGVKATLNCDAAPVEPEASTVQAPAGVEASPAEATPVAKQKKLEPNQQLRWLRTIEELREHQLLSAEEERRIRRRILERDH